MTDVAKPVIIDTTEKKNVEMGHISSSGNVTITQISGGHVSVGNVKAVGNIDIGCISPDTPPHLLEYLKRTGR